jgi:ribosome biogenesis SPOUT family RNA methylase Rps3
MNTIFIIEHCDDEVYDWSLIEYTHISYLIGKDRVWFTHTANEKLKEIGTVKPESVTNMDLKKACILDPFAEKTLSPGDDFDYLVFGGILGDNPPTKKTAHFLSSKVTWEKRNLGPEQMATDNAVYTAFLIAGGTPLDKLEFQQDLTIHIHEGEEVMLPYKYIIKDGKPLIAPDLVKRLKEEDEF